MSEVLTNPYRYGAPSFDDTDLKAYWKFNTNPTSGDISNVSEAAASLGNGADLQVSGATYDTTSPFGYGISLDGVNDYMVAGTSLSQFNFMHEAGATWTINYWVVEQTGISFGYIMNTNEYDTYKVGMSARGDALAPDGNMYVDTTDGLAAGGWRYAFGTTADMVPLLDTWYMITSIMNYGAGSGSNVVQYRDGGNKDTTGTLQGGIPSGNAIGEMTLGARANLHDRNAKIKLTEMSVWDRVLTDDEVSNLYNGGSGLPIY